MPLSEQERAVLDLERTWWKDGCNKAAAVRARLGLSLSRYNQLLSRLASNKDAEVYDPLVVARVRKAQAERRRRKAGAPPAWRPTATSVSERATT